MTASTLYQPAEADYVYQDLLEPGQGVGFVADLDEHITTLLTYASALTTDQVERLLEGLGRVFQFDEPAAARAAVSTESGSFDVAGEVHEQIRALKALRQAIIEGNGRLRDGVTAREAQALIQSAATVVSLLVKYQKEFLNQDRQRRLEQAVIEVLREEDAALAERVLRRFSEDLQ
jgi:hypothetical protein